ncbi:IS21-like element ISMac3 family transposase [Desulfatiferula olefinivorans]
MDIITLYRRGLSQHAISRELGISRNTVKKYIDNPDLAFNRPQRQQRPSQLDPYIGNITTWIEEDKGYMATWIYDRLTSMGFTGSYEIVKRKVRQIKERHQKVAFMRFETEPGYQAQVDFAEFQIEHPNGHIEKLYLFSMVLGYSRKTYAELIKRCDLPTFLDCHIRAFEFFGGIPSEILYDRMKNVYIGRLAGRDRFNDTLVGFACHYGFNPKVAPAYAAWVKGKVERPYAFIREGFWRGYGYVCLETANRDLMTWLAKKEQRVHGTTHEVVAVRFDREQPHLGSLPRKAVDTSYRIVRKVYKDCTLRFEGNSFVVPHQLVGKQLVLRVKDHIMRIYDDDRFVVIYEIPSTKGNLVQEKRFYRDLKNDRDMNRRKYGHVKPGKGRAKHTISPLKPAYDIPVDIRPLDVYDAYVKEVRI